MSKINNISGFPEWLPAQKLAEDRIISQIKRVYESFGFTPIETPAVELMTTLSSKGVVDKEIYRVIRAHAESQEEADYGLHFDLSVPFVRYVAQHFSELVFPFKRYQIQKVWRGDRPQRGRFREFYQCDIDTIVRDELPLACDAEVVTVLDKVLTTINIAPHKIRFNNRKVLLGIYKSLGLDEATRKATMVVVDKVDKIGQDGVTRELSETLKLEASAVAKIVDLTRQRVSPNEAEKLLNSLEIKDDLFDQGKSEVLRLLELIPEASRNRIVFDLSISRGLDYYTGAVFEFSLPDFPQFGTVAAGGRYDGLASQFINQKLPGVGLSIGLTRLMDLAFSEARIEFTKKTPSKVLVTVLSEEQRVLCNEAAETLRAFNIPSEVYFKSPKLGKQIDYADAKGIPFVLFLEASDGTFQIKNLATKEQVKVQDLADWATLYFSQLASSRSKC